MTGATVEIRLALNETAAEHLRATARARGMTEAEVVEQALDLLRSLDDPSLLDDYLFSVGAMREDCDNMPEDWIADELNDAIPTG